MGLNLRSLLLAVFVISNSITWTASRHHFTHNVLGHRSRHRRQGAGLYLPASFVIPGGAGSGPWGDWGEITSCSRTCGGGVASQKRICLEIAPDGRATCTGGDTKYFSCETADCPAGDDGDFRAAQCAEYDEVPFRGIKHKWIPYTNGQNKCELNCMPKGERFYYRHKAKVTDGTRCSTESYDVCVDGTCQPVGCDMMLGSTAREDKCRVCRGDGSSCRTIRGRDTQDFIKGYNDVLRIPEGATNIYIGEVRESNNYLALHTPADAANGSQYLLNGDYHIDFPRALVIAGATWHYERRQQGFAAPDRLRCLGPTTEPLILSLLVQDENVGIDYEYSVPSALAPPPGARYGWVFGQFSPCTVSCGIGFQTRNVTCRSLTGPEPLEDVVSENLCDADLRPPNNATCNMGDCAAEWVPGPWSPCTKPCGEGGSRRREVHCEKVITNGVSFNYKSTVSDEECFKLLGPKPALHEECNKEAACPTWFTGPWKPCDKLCDEGQQTRQVVCHLKKNGRVEVLPPGACADERPAEQQPCLLRPCEGVDWVHSEWTGCDNCLSQVKSREVQCATKLHEVVDAAFCVNHPKPDSEQLCDPKELPPCHAQWYATQWGNCSVECGKGVKTRLVFCGLYDNSSVVRVDDSKCETEKYNDTAPCEITPDKCPAKWFAGPWTDCTKRCGGGMQYRKTMCLSGGQEVSGLSGCAQDNMLDDARTCNTGSCNADQMMPVNAAATPVMEEGEEEYCVEEEDGLEIGAELDHTDSDLGYFSDSPDGSASSEYTETGTTESGSGDTMDTDVTAESTTDFMQTFETDSTGSTESEATVETNNTDESTGSEAITESGATDITATATGSDLTEVTETVTTDATSSTDSTLAGSDSTEATETVTTDATSSTDSTLAGSDSTEATETVTTDATSSTDSTLAGSESTEVTETVTTDATNSTDSTLGSSGSTEVTETVTTDATSITDSTLAGSVSTEVTESTDSTGSTEVTETTGSEGSTVSSASSVSDITETGSTESTVSAEDTSSTATENTASTVTEEIGQTTETDITTQTTEATGDSSTTEAGSTGDTSSSGSESSLSTTEGITGSSSDTSELSTTEITTDSTTDETGSTKVDTTGTVSESDITGPTESGITETSEASTESIGTGSTDATGSTEVTETASTDVSTTEVTSESGPTETSESEGTEATGSTTESSSSTEYTGSEDTSETGESTLWDWASTLATTTKRHCLPRRAKCERSVFGCCPDNKTAAGGPFEEGCPKLNSTCKNTKFGCCPDGVSPATRAWGKGCPSAHCEQTLFGCCHSDGSTPAEGNDQEGCPPPPPACRAAKHGCCKDGQTGATGPRKEGCPETTTTTEAPEPGEEVEGCAASEFGCCHDNETEAAGPDGQGCPCNATEFGCCPDNVTTAIGPEKEGCMSSCREHGCCGDGKTPAHGPGGLGCCLLHAYGCCPDNYKPAAGPDLEGCECQGTQFGCCPDNVTIARGSNKEGCGCEYSEHGCCEDRHTEAAGPNYEGCGCHTYQFGCCPDGVTVVKGPRLQGCHCRESAHGCCGDGVTAAAGPDRAGCDCASSQYGCCPDGQTEATGRKFEGCTDIPENQQAACALPYDQGTHKPDYNYTAFWYYDMQYGGCSRFWYGGADGNGNRFLTKEDCEDNCVHPRGKDKCRLPKVHGSCRESQLRWYYDAHYEQCVQFTYSGCLGNYNNFETRELCQAECRPDRDLEQCAQAIDRGECNGTFERWGFEAAEGRCRPFSWGGCGGSDNRFGSEAACMLRCRPPGELQPECMQSQEPGNSDEKIPAWSFNVTENRCLPFYYTGHGGNANRFADEQTCAAACPSVFEKQVCELPAVTGDCSNYEVKWFYDLSIERCRQFHYGGCGGNGNRFASEQECQNSCAGAGTSTTTQRPAPSPVVDNIFKHEYCFLEKDSGPCSGNETRWAYSAGRGDCEPFRFGGCAGNRNSFPSREYCLHYCQTAQDLCQLPMKTGGCDASLPRWFYDAAFDRCSQFAFSGCDGNDNNFGSAEECERRCRTGPAPEPAQPELTTTTVAPVQLSSECQVSSLSLCTGVGRVWYLHPATGECAPYDTPAGEGCDARGVFPSPEACERTCGAFRGLDVCRYPLNPGYCSENQPKFYFDAETGACAPFTYGGCHGGPNRFSTINECEDICRPQTDPCQQPPERGNCIEYHEMWYYDPVRNECNPFAYTGCGGNQNRFQSREQCEGQCRSMPAPAPAPPASTPRAEVATPAPRPAQPVDEECRAPESLQPCGAPAPAFYFDAARGACVAAPNGGCRYAGTWRTEEECERRCGAFRGIDVCRMPLNPGPCRDRPATKLYWDMQELRCKSFTYGGCSGGPNRFSTFEECQEVCAHLAPDPACRLPAAEGAACAGAGAAGAAGERRWFYSALHGECRPLLYLGCGGNDNNFLTFQQCASLCSPSPDDQDNQIIPDILDCRAAQDACAALQCEYSVQRIRGPDGCESCACIVPEPNCAKLEEECANITCRYGSNITRGADGCRRCGCLPHPCAELACPRGQRCVPAADRDPVTQDVRYSAECRIENKPGACPAESPTASGCRRECGDDADCRGAAKCCAAGCSQLCRAPVEPATERPAIDDRVAQRPQAPQPDPQTEREVAAQEGGLATLRCLFHSNPPPKITWRRGEITIDGDVDRYRLTSDGALEIASLYRNDSGVYICIAENELGRAYQEVILRVGAPVTERSETDVRMAARPQAPQPDPQTEREVAAQEGGLATLRCLFHSNPPPKITWRRGEITIDGDKDRYRLTSDGALEIASLYRNDSGVYICIAQNELGRAQQEVTLRINDPWPQAAGIAGPPEAVLLGEVGRPLSIRCLVYGFPTPSVAWFRGPTGPMVPYYSEQYEARGHVLLVRALDVAALGQYTCQAYNGIDKPAMWTVEVRAPRRDPAWPASHYLLPATEPLPGPPARPEPPALVATTTQATQSTQPIAEYPYVPYTDPVRTALRPAATSLAAGAELSLPCEVDGYPEPDVRWTKDGARLQPGDRLQLTAARLTLRDLTVADSGEYGCHAQNEFSSHSSSVVITVQELNIPAQCTDNQFFANCQLIVRSKFCNHKYYSTFCCKSCVEAGLLNPQNLQLQADQSWMNK